MSSTYKIALIRINRILRGWANYFKHAVAKHTMARPACTPGPKMTAD
ncbi:group II intron maturase-specific domain-containing protein [Streptomyces sp. NPDC059680]